MKKILSITLAILIIAVLMIPMAAVKGGTSYGIVKKVDDSNIDMSKADMSEPAWENALKIPVARNREGNAAAAKGDVYLLWSDTAYYAFFDITDTTPINDPDRAAKLEPWITDSVEFFIDETNEGLHCEQFRVDRDGIPSYYPKAGAWTADMLIGATKISDSEAVPAEYMSWVVKTEGNKFYVKMKVTFFDSVTAKDIGVHLQLNDLEVVGGSNTSTWPTDNTANSWESEVYGFVTLSEEPAYIEVIVEEAAAVAESPSEPVKTAAPVASPQTNDASSIILVLFAIAAISGVVVLKKKKV